jgi:sugar O-acyltransferase (sialic acid O-acetyltransferase NeuD family)
MVIIGAKGHALEILDVLLFNREQERIYFFDDVSKSFELDPINQYQIIRSPQELKKLFSASPSFALGTGKPSLRKKLSAFCKELGGELSSVISADAYISSLGVDLAAGLNIMHRVMIHPQVKIGEGTLINAGVIIHPESRIGSYCEICPSAVITGKVTIGNEVMIGAGAILLPGVNVGDNAIIGAGAVVTRDVQKNTMVAGVPATVKS